MQMRSVKSLTITGSFDIITGRMMENENCIHINLSPSTVRDSYLYGLCHSSNSKGESLSGN